MLNDNKKDTTSWGGVADWYHEHLLSEGTYHADVILPNLLRLMNIKTDEQVLDLACGEGFFSRAFHEAGAKVTGVDISPELVALARRDSPKEITFAVSRASNLHSFPARIFSAVTIVLAIQNIEDVKEVFFEIERVLAPSGKIFIVMNHPAFRVPKCSSWEWDDKSGKQFRRIDSYMTESREKILMHPGKTADTTITFHRPLQYYSKLLSNTGFSIGRIEEWISPKKSQAGPRSKEEDRMRREIPLFICFEVVHNSSVIF